MKSDWSHIEANRLLTGPYGSKRGMPCGVFIFRGKRGDEQIEVIADNGALTGWEHASVKGRKLKGKNHVTAIPGWDCMAAVKDLFWEPEETVMQIHPPKSQYVNTHPHVLHLWRPLFTEIPRPPTVMV